MGDTSGAHPLKLYHYADLAAQINTLLSEDITNVATAIDTLQSRCRERHPGIDAAFVETLRAYVAYTTEMDEWVRTVGQGFEAADSGTATPTPEPAPTPVPAPTAAPTPTPTADTGWPLVMGAILPPASDPIMRALAEKITATRNKLVQRYQELREDKHDLYPINPAEKFPYGSWDGHVEQYEGWRRRLIKAFEKWYELEGELKYPDALPGDASKWKKIPPPSKPAPFTLLPPEQMHPNVFPAPTAVPDLTVPPFPAPTPVPGMTVPPFPAPTPVPGMTVPPFPAPTPVPGMTVPPFPAVQPQGPIIYQSDTSGIDGGDVLKGAAVTGGVAFGGYLIYRGVRMIPSLFPPFWGTIPANLAIP